MKENKMSNQRQNNSGGGGGGGCPIFFLPFAVFILYCVLLGEDLALSKVQVHPSFGHTDVNEKIEVLHLYFDRVCFDNTPPNLNTSTIGIRNTNGCFDLYDSRDTSFINQLLSHNAQNLWKQTDTLTYIGIYIHSIPWIGLLCIVCIPLCISSQNEELEACGSCSPIFW